MDKLQSSIKGIIQEAEQLNNIKLAAIKEIEGRLNTCPTQWLSATNNFIKIVRTNISRRQSLVRELREKKILNDPQRLIDITYELQDIDSKDLIASNVYNSIMDEEMQ